MSTTLLSTILEDYCYSRSLHYLCAHLGRVPIWAKFYNNTKK